MPKWAALLWVSFGGQGSRWVSAWFELVALSAALVLAAVITGLLESTSG